MLMHEKPCLIPILHVFCTVCPWITIHFMSTSAEHCVAYYIQKVGHCDLYVDFCFIQKKTQTKRISCTLWHSLGLPKFGGYIC